MVDILICFTLLLPARFIGIPTAIVPNPARPPKKPVTTAPKAQSPIAVRAITMIIRAVAPNIETPAIFTILPVFNDVKNGSGKPQAVGVLFNCY